MGGEAPARRSWGPDRAHRARARAPALHLTLLGGFRLTEDATERRLPLGAQRLVALVALNGAPLRRRAAATTLWPHLDARVANGTLRSTLSRLRALVPALIPQSESRALQLAATVTVDVRLLELSPSRLHINRDAVLALAPTLAAELLPDWDEEWVALERERLGELTFHAIEAVAASLTEERLYAEAIALAYVAIRLDPLRESAMRTLIKVHLAEGNRVQAARCYVDFRNRLRAALRIEPSSEMTALVAPLVSSR